jgi:iron complex outermembrane receptor protein
MSALAADNPAEVMELGRIDVIGTTPLPGLGTPLANVPANVQVFGARGLERQRPITLPDFLERNAAATSLNAAQGNPFQPDLLYRGFVASPLLGLPQGLSVFQDGVRLNEPFGEVVNWDLIPQSAIASVQLMPGSAAVFGPNTLGGALAIYTKSGSQFPGGALQAYGGSFGRAAVEFEQGGSSGAWDWFATAHGLHDQGWAEHNPSRIGQLFAKVGYQTDRSDLDVSVTLADNTLSGMQTVPRSFEDMRQPYTYPDTNTNRLGLLSLKGSAFLADAWLLGATAYLRSYRNGTMASNASDDFASDATAPEAINDRSTLDQKGGGAGLQLTHSWRRAARANHFVVGASVDSGRARYSRFEQPASFTSDRGTFGTGDYALQTDADTRTDHYAVFVTDTYEPNAQWAITGTLRHNSTRLRIGDRSGEDPELAGRHRWQRASPALGATWHPMRAFTAYGSYTESIRMPTAIELTCADPGAPCRLPNAFLTDPPLSPVVARTAEFGTRGRFDADGSWSLALFRTDLDDDIQFVSSGGGTTAGYFRNVGRTRREGIEAALSNRWGPFSLDARASFLNATFRAPFTATSPANSTADDNGQIAVRPGDRIPGIAQRSVKLRLDYEGKSASAGVVVLAQGATHARGDENNADAYGRVPGYAVVNLDARWRIAASTEIFVRVDNALDKRYAGFGALGFNAFASGHFDPAHAVAEPFYGYGVPRGAWAGARLTWR